MPDGWEIYHEMEPLLEDADADADNGLYTNGMECLMDTDPRSPSDYPPMRKGFDADMDVDGSDLIRLVGGIVSGVDTPTEVQMFAEAR